MDEQVNKFRALDEWFKTPQGVRVAHAFAAELAPHIEKIRGKRVLQLGSCGDNLWLPSQKFTHKVLASPTFSPRKVGLITSLSVLPFERNSFDCVLAPLTLEAFPSNKNPLDEIDRILKPMGYAVFLGVNPLSFWGGALRLGHEICFGQMPAILTSSLTLKRAMLNRGYRQCILTSFYFIPPVRSAFLIKNLEFFNEMGKMIWPFPAGFYCFIAQKYQHQPPAFVGFEEHVLAGARL